ncbi:MAG: endonuclease [Rhodobacteraceae bacterium PARR1]|nr:MAG: endonuclease [Rhodobacteraceae bacterium PARR1]
MATPPLNVYRQLVERIFFDTYKAGLTEIPWERSDLERAAQELGVPLPKNLGDVVYSIRYRTAMPASILQTQPDGQEWIISGMGRARYAFRLVPINRIRPREELVAIKIPDATPEIIAAYAVSDEQALLAKVRYNRLIDLFLELVTYSLQNHLRTTVKGIGQIEIDEIYVGLDKRGRQFIVPVQAKGGSDQLSTVQTEQDLKCCAEKYPALIPRAVSAQFIEDDLIALFELTVEAGAVRVVDERHYRLVPSSQITADDLRLYGLRS